MAGRDNPSNKKSGRSWFLILFSLPFAGVGIGILLFSITPTLYDWARMRSWQPVAAQVVAAELKTHSGDDSDTYSVLADYRYEVAGVAYQGTRVAIGAMADNIGEFQQALGARLEAAARQESPVMIWVNPQNPSESVVDRSLRPGLLFFNLIFVVLFGGVGCGLLVYQLFFNQRQATGSAAENSEKPWLARADWAANRIGCRHKKQLWFAWLFTIFWNLISTPVAFVVPGEFSKGNYPILLALLFPLVGAGLFWWAISLTRDWQRYGAVFLQLDPFPGSIGGQVGGTLDLPVAFDSSPQFRVTLNCIYSYSSGSGDNDGTREKCVWQAEGIAVLQARSSGIRLQFLFDVPDNLPASEREDLPYHSWRLDIKSLTPHVRFSRQFIIPVYATRQSARYIRDQSVQHPALVESRLDQIEAVCQFQQVQGGVDLFFPLFRSWKTPFMGLVFGIIFAGSGFAIGYADGPFIFPLVFGGIGTIAVLSSLNALFDSRRVRLDQNGYFGRRWWLGIPVRSRTIPREKLRRLHIKESYSSQSGNEFSTVYKIMLELESGAKIKIADSLRGEAIAQQLAESISLYSGVPFQVSAIK